MLAGPWACQHRYRSEEIKKLLEPNGGNSFKRLCCKSCLLGGSLSSLLNNLSGAVNNGSSTVNNSSSTVNYLFNSLNGLLSSLVGLLGGVGA